jgi:hypothetical protein
MRRPGLLVGLPAVAVVLLLLLPVGSAAPAPRGPVGEIIPLQGQNSSGITLTLNSTPTYLNANFWGTTVSARDPLFANESALVNATPARVVVWPGANAGDDYDPFNNLLYANNNTSMEAPTSEAQFVAWCKTIHCTAIFEVPGVLNNPSVAEAIVNYTERNLSFIPTYWEIGNEPGFWEHWGQPWGDWGTTTAGPSPTQYADEVYSYVQAMDQSNPAHPVKLIGLPGVGRAHYPIKDWIDEMIDVDGANLSAIAVHIYPDLSLGTDSLAYYYSTLNGTTNSQSIPGRIPTILADIAQAIPTSPSCEAAGGCGAIPLFFTEIGSAISDRPDAAAYSEQFAGGLYIASEATQAIDANVSNVDAFGTVLDTANSWFTPSGNPRPEYTIYSSVLSHLGSTAYTVDVTSPSPTVSGNVYATSTLAPSDGDRSDLLVVNTNLGVNVSFAPTLPDYTAGTPVEVWSWDGTNISGDDGVNVAPSTPAPVASFYPDGLPASYTLAQQSLALFEAFPAGGAPVTLDMSGLPAHTRWFFGAGPDQGTTTSGSLSFFLPLGSYATVPGPAIGVPRHLSTERYEPAAAQSFALGSAGVTLAVPFALQYTLNLTVRPLAAGSAGRISGWVDADSNITLTAAPAAGFAFRAWYGWGAGSYNGSENPARLEAKAPLHETAIFAVGFAVTFEETGLAAGTAWSVVLRNTTLAGATASLVDVVVNGTYGFSVPPVPGYIEHPASAFVRVVGAPVTVDVAFHHPAAATYAVTWTETGLPAGTSWSVSVRNLTLTSTGTTVVMAEPNGTYTYALGNVTEYRASPPKGGLTVAGAPVTVRVAFEPKSIKAVDYAVVFTTGAAVAGGSWAVRFGGREALSANASVSFAVPNGSYTFSVLAPHGYTASPQSGGLTVNGTPLATSVAFTAVPPDPPHTPALIAVPPVAWAAVAHAMFVVAVVAAVGVLTFFLLYRRAKHDAPESPPQPNWDERVPDLAVEDAFLEQMLPQLGALAPTTDQPTR